MKKSIQIIILLIAIGFNSFTQEYEYIAPVKYNGKWGIIDKTGKWKVEPIIDVWSINNFSENGLAKVYNGGFIDKTGKFIISLEEVTATRSIFSEGMIPVRKNNGKCGFIDETGKIVIPLQYDDAFNFSESLAVVAINGKYGFIDKTGKIVIPLQYDDAFNFSEGLAKVVMNRKYGFINKTGKIVIPLQYDLFYNVDGFSEGLARVEINKKWGFIDKTGKVISPIQYDYAGDFSEGLAYVENDNDKCGFIDKTGKIVIPLQYDDANNFSEGLALVEINKKYGFIDKTGKIVIPLQYDEANEFSEGLAVVEINEKYGFIDKTGQIVIPLQYDYAVDFSEGLASVVINEKSGFIDKTGKIVIPLLYDDYFISSFSKVTFTDNIPPEITITDPNVSRGFKPVEQNKQITIQGNAKDASGIFEVLVNGQDAYIDANGNFTKNVLLAVGDNSFTVTATDIKQNTSTKTFIIERKSQQQETVIVNETINNTNVLQTGKYYALIIGNNSYQDNAISSLNEPINDATKLYNVLTTQYTFEPQNVTFLKNATYVQMIEAFDNLSNTLTENDNLLVFYAGHGWWDEDKNLGYWLPTDAKKNSTAFWIGNSRISDYMSSIKSKHTLLIADACFSGSIFKTRSAFSDAQPAINKLYELPSKTAMTSGNLKEVPDKSVFLQYLVKRLNENTEKYISADILFASFRIAVMNNSTTEPQFGTIQNAGDEGGEFIFIRSD